MLKEYDKQLSENACYKQHKWEAKVKEPEQLVFATVEDKEGRRNANHYKKRTSWAY